MRTVDAELDGRPAPAGRPASIARTVRARVRRERPAAVRESLPDLIHLAAAPWRPRRLAALLPDRPTVTIAAVSAFTCVTYVFMAVVRWSIESLDQPNGSGGGT